MDSAEEQKLAKQKAMGALFLSHKVKELEKSVNQISFNRDSRLYNDTSNSSPRKSNGTKSGSTSGSSKIGSGSMNNNGNGERRIRETRIVDVSVLVHALPVLKRWIREDRYLLVIPLEVISTLDEFKKSPQPLKDQAAEATRFLETYFGIAQQILSEPTASSKPQSINTVEDSRIRLRPQVGNEESSWIQLEQEFKVPMNYKIIKPDGYVDPILEEGEEKVEPFPNVLDIPKSIRSTLQCALYFQSRTASISTTAKPITSTTPSTSTLPSIPIPALLTYPLTPSSIYLPSFPLHYPLPPAPISATSNSNSVDFTSLSSGNSLTYFSTTFLHLKVQEISREEVQSAREWIRNLAREKERESGGGNGSNGGKSGGGNGRGGRSNGSARGGGGGGKSTSGRGGGTNSGRGGVLFVP